MQGGAVCMIILHVHFANPCSCSCMSSSITLQQDQESVPCLSADFGLLDFVGQTCLGTVQIARCECVLVVPIIIATALSYF